MGEFEKVGDITMNEVIESAQEDETVVLPNPTKYNNARRAVAPVKSVSPNVPARPYYQRDTVIVGSPPVATLDFGDINISESLEVELSSKGWQEVILAKSMEKANRIFRPALQCEKNYHYFKYSLSRTPLAFPERARNHWEVHIIFIRVCRNELKEISQQWRKCSSIAIELGTRLYKQAIEEDLTPPFLVTEENARNIERFVREQDLTQLWKYCILQYKPRGAGRYQKKRKGKACLQRSYPLCTAVHV